MTETLDRMNPWDRLGTKVTGATNALSAMETAGLFGWNMRKAEIKASDNGGLIDINGSFAVVRDIPGSEESSALSIVGAGYHIIQNEEHAQLLDIIAAETGAVYDSAGEINGGKHVFISMRLPQKMNIGGIDPVDLYIAAVNGHDGKMAFHFMTTPVRLACANMLNVGLEKSTSSFRVRHSVGAPAFMKQRAIEAMKHSMEYVKEFETVADQLINTPMSTSEFEQIIRAEFGAAPGAPVYTKTRCDNKIDRMMQLFADADTQSQIRDTAWAGFNAITEWSDHFSHTRRKERGIALATKALLDPRVKNSALRLMTRAGGGALLNKTAV